MFTMREQRSSCPHISIVEDYVTFKEDILLKQSESTCDYCDNAGPNLCVCLHRGCLKVGCNDLSNSHTVKHFQMLDQHCLMLNLSTLQVYCLLCKCEVFLENNDPPIPGMLPSPPLVTRSDTDSEDELESSDDNIKPRGLTGLKNVGNTCYMNSALQSLSNCPQLTNFFLDCGSFVRSDKKPGLSKCYMILIKEMWHRNRPSYVVPSLVAYGFKLVFPVFRGNTQQDAQEFLRCFLDQLHEELKEPVVELLGVSSLSPVSHDEFEGPRSDSGIPVSDESSQSDGDYETCSTSSKYSCPNSEKDSCADESIIEHSDPSQESSDILITSPTLFSKQSGCYVSSATSDSLSGQVESGYASYLENSLSRSQGIPSPGAGEGILNNKTKIINGVLPDCTLQVSNVKPTLASNVALCCEVMALSHYVDAPLLKEDSRSNLDTTPLTDNCDPNLMNSPLNEKLSNMPSPVSSSHISCNKGAYSLQQTSQSKHVTSQTIINSMVSARKKKPVQYRSIISDTFDGKILSSVQCLTCDTVSYTKETFQDLSLPIPNRDHLHMLHATQGSHQKSGGTCTDVYSHKGWFNTLFSWMLSWFWGPSISLQDCLAAFFSADELKGDNMYRCEKCKKLKNGIKYSKVIELPEVLCIHLKRFRHEINYSSKISSHVTFPLEGLDMSPFLHKSYPPGVTTYDLASVICHQGTPGSGHYITYSLNYLNEQWYEFDDKCVTAVNAEVVRKCEAYVLFYRKCTEEMIKKRQCAVELLDRSKNEPGLLKFHVSKQWINKFNNFAEPGPITNTDFLCIHGGVPPQKADYASELCTVLPQAVWEYLHDTFGGGPPCTHLYVCYVCEAELERLNKTRKKELDAYITLNAKKKRDNPSVMYALSMNWFKTWETFVNKDGEIPGPIDNSTICELKNNQPVLKSGSEYCAISKEMYEYFFHVYGGGPDIALQQILQTNSGPQFSSSGSSSVSLTTNTVPSSSCNYVQNIQVHSSSKANLSSQNQQTSSGSGIQCDILPGSDITDKFISSGKTDEPSDSEVIDVNK